MLFAAVHKSGPGHEADELDVRIDGEFLEDKRTSRLTLKLPPRCAETDLTILDHQLPSRVRHFSSPSCRSFRPLVLARGFYVLR
jgi:hypothetical protein